MKVNKANVMVNKDTGKRLTLRETRELKKDGTYKEQAISLAEYEQLQKSKSRSKQKKQHNAKVAVLKKRKAKIEKRREIRKYNFGINKRFSKKIYHTVISENALTNNDGKVLFDVEGIHTMGNGKLEPRHNKYHFKVTDKTEFLEYLQIGVLASVQTKKGRRRIMITDISKPRAENKKEQTEKYNDVVGIYRTTWINVIKELEKAGEINSSSRFCGREVAQYAKESQQTYRKPASNVDKSTE